MDAHAEGAGVPPSRLVWESMQSKLPHHALTDNSHKIVCIIRWFGEPPPPLLKGWIR
jgi:hypothetical protein